MVRVILSIIFLLNISLFANNADVQTDIMARTINFVIFVMIMYYLLANPAREFFSNRSQEIKDRLEEVQNRLKQSKKAKEEAQEELANAQKLAKQIVEDAKADSVVISQSYDKSTNEHLRSLEEHFQQAKTVELRQAKKDVVSEVLDEIFTDEAISITQEEIAQKLLKKVA
jgi:F-type H+-transporting ATPase subunit b